MMRYFIKVTIVIALLYSELCFSQQDNKAWFLIDSIRIESLSKSDKAILDSILKVYHKANKQTKKLSCLLFLSENLGSENLWPKYNQLLFETASALPPTNENLKFKVSALNNLGFLLQRNGDLTQALFKNNEAFLIAKEINDLDGQASLLNNMAVIYDIQGEVTKAIEFYNQSLKIKERAGNKKGIAQTISNLAGIYKKQGSIKNAEEYYMKALEIRKEIDDKHGLAEIYNSLGAIKIAQKNYKSAFAFLSISMSLYKELNDQYGETTALINIGNMHTNNREFEKALECFKKNYCY